jgi:hypothetical protein
MLGFERHVVDALTSGDDPRVRGQVAQWVEDVLSDMPEHLRLGVMAESVAFGALSRVSGRSPGALLDVLDRSPIGLLRQYPRLFRSLVLYAELELTPGSTRAA